MTKTNINQSNTNTQHRLPLYRRAWFLALIVIIAIAAVVCLIIFLVKPKQLVSADNVEQKTNDTAQEESTPDSSPQVDNGQHVNEDVPYSDPDQITVQYEGENPNRANDLSGTITYTSYNDGVLAVGTMINQYLSQGTCDLKLTGSAGNVYTASSEIVAAASTSACYDLRLNVPQDTYQIEITLSSDSKQGTITGEVSL